jgi:hypothetical protein
MRENEETYPVNLRTDGIGGIPKRNQRMVDRGADLCLAFIGQTHVRMSRLRAVRLLHLYRLRG